MNENAGDQAQAGIEAAAAGGESLLGLAMLGKTAAALGLILAILFLAAAALRRWGPYQRRRGGQLRVIDSTMVGPKERVAIVQVKETWLVLGVGNGRVEMLHSLPADSESPAEGDQAPLFADGDSFGTRFAKALKRNAGLDRRRGS
ncbi:flagellar protein FliO/FliZ [Halomonas shengliensis]|uniref:Flagellar protein n=1 Tax=Halomonas shengliensis TaxID=419597 RepID=A0A1H0EYJ6_9GAMM|nr:flagellar biosynthetic protein FliO [Halomonas shengliensis]SDN87452.1 flagellar protein FliO/FliZ [Halomonas shengliensis]